MAISDCGFRIAECCDTNFDTMGERIRRIGRIDTDFLFFFTDFKQMLKIKIRINPLNPPNPFSHSITIRITTFRNPKSTIRNPLIHNPKS
jgi:hypothetical protein